MKAIRIASVVVVVYVVLSLLLGAAIGYFQPKDAGTSVLRTVDADGLVHETVLRVLEDDDGQLWLLSAKWFRSWYHRALANPNVELVRDGNVMALCAEPVRDEPSIDHVIQLRHGNMGAMARWSGRATVLFAPVKVLNLSPPPSAGSQCR